MTKLLEAQSAHLLKLTGQMTTDIDTLLRVMLKRSLQRGQ